MSVAKRTSPSLSFLVFRIGSVVAFSLVALAFESLGPERFTIAGYCALVGAPLLILMEVLFPSKDHAWTQPIMDCILCVVGVMILPAVWSAGFMVGLVAANSRLLVSNRSGVRAIVAAHVVLLVGMLAVALWYDVPGWEIQFAAVLAVIPGVFFYAMREAVRIGEEHVSRDRMSSMVLIAGGVAHDFNNLLTGIQVNAHLARQSLDASHPSNESINAVLEASRRASMLTQQLTDLASGRMGSPDTDVHLDSEIRTLVGLLQSVMPRDVRIHLNSTSTTVVRTDRVQLQQIIMNLVINAAEAVEPPSEIHVDVKTSKQDGQDELFVVIEDGGKGIASGELRRIFEPFFSSKSSGSGIGLSNANRIVANRGGKILVDSQVGVGTKMTVILPVEIVQSDDLEAGQGARR